jgi:hypothetical protein
MDTPPCKNCESFEKALALNQKVWHTDLSKGNHPGAQHTKMKTIAQLQIGLNSLTTYENMAARTGMTVGQCAAAHMVQSLAADMTADQKAILADQSKALPILAEIAEMPAGDDARVLAAIK